MKYKRKSKTVFNGFKTKEEVYELIRKTATSVVLRGNYFFETLSTFEISKKEFEEDYELVQD